MCYDIDPKHPTCIFALTKLYHAFGLLPPLFNAAEQLLRTKYDSRGVIPRRMEWMCEIPRFLMELYLLPLRHELTRDRALYVLLLVIRIISSVYDNVVQKYMMHANDCSGNGYTLSDKADENFRLMKSDFNGKCLFVFALASQLIDIYKIPIDKSLCFREDVRRMLNVNEISLHPCLANTTLDQCNKYTKTPPPTDVYINTHYTILTSCVDVSDSDL